MVIPTQQLPVGADDGSSEAFSSASQESVPEVETSLEWQPTPQVQHRLHYLDVRIQRTQILLQKCYTYMLHYEVTSQVSPTEGSPCARYFQTHK